MSETENATGDARDARTINCEEALRLLATYLDGELVETDRGRLERHLALCRSCFSRQEFERKLKAQLAELGQEPVRPEFRQRVRTLVRRFATNGSAQQGGGDGRHHVE